MVEGKIDTKNGVVVGRITDVKFNNQRGLVAVEAELDMLPGGRLRQSTAALRATGVSEEPYADRIEGVTVSPVSLPTRVEFQDVQAAIGSEDEDLQLLFDGEVVATATLEELEEVQDTQTQTDSLERRVAKLEEHVEELTQDVRSTENVSEEGSSSVEDGVTAIDPDKPDFGDIFGRILDI